MPTSVSGLTTPVLRDPDLMSTSKHISAHPKYRPDIDGLRAIAVLSVVAFHAFPTWMNGGFIGVDIFFVISGFLISTIIFESLDKEVFSFSGFYVRRINRIFPALLLVLVVSYAVGWFVLLSDEYRQLGVHIAAGAGFVSNFVFWSEAGYFDSSAETKPLLHLWSLGIEEQFYIVWPLVLWFAWKRNFNLLTLAVVAAFVSFVLNFRGAVQDPVATFYSPQTRFWELLSGSVLAWFALYKKNIHENIKLKVGGWLAQVSCRKGVDVDCSALSNTLSLLGCLFLVYGFWQINKTLSFPGVWAVVPVLGTLLIILAGPKAWINRYVLSNKILVWFGLISFPLYLWHWPLLSFLRIIEGDVPAAVLRVVVVIFSIVFAWLTYRFIERPVRSKFSSSRRVSAFLLLSMILVGLVGSVTYVRNGFDFRLSEYEENFKGLSAPILEYEAGLCRELIPGFSGHCIASHKDVNSEFKYIFLGDSHARALSMGLLSKGDAEYSFIQLGKLGCPFLKNIERYDYEKPYHCYDAYDQTINYLGGLESNNIVFISMYYTAYYSGVGYGIAKDSLHIQRKAKGVSDRLAASPDTYSDAFSASLRETLTDVSPLFNQVVIVLQPPEVGVNMKQCAGRPFQKYKDCSFPKSLMVEHQKNYREEIFREVSRFANVSVYDPAEIFCNDEACSPFVDGKLAYRDDNHINMAGSIMTLNELLAKYDSSVK